MIYDDLRGGRLTRIFSRKGTSAHGIRVTSNTAINS